MEPSGNHHIRIESVHPCVDGGRSPVKRVADDPFIVKAVLFRDGHDVVRAVLQWTDGDRPFTESEMRKTNVGMDEWEGSFALTRPGRYLYAVEAWTDPFATWHADFRKRVEGKQEDVTSEIQEGLRLLERVQTDAKGEDREELTKVIESLRQAQTAPPAALDVVSGDRLTQIMIRLQPRDDAVRSSPELKVDVHRLRARFGAWYELFIRSQGSDPGISGTFQDATKRLDDLKQMGFDVLYLAPIHPIGKTKRKGKNNSLQAGPDDPGSPWAIGSEAGGHTDIEPALGTLEDFDNFVSEAKIRKMEIALDFAIQCSPDHPWVKEHPDWFYHRPDGTIKFAENPPKKYEDIYPLDFDTQDWKALWNEWKRITLFWAKRGVRIFRVDNPHTKPLPFWEWLIREVRSEYPDTVFLAEAFTRPPVMHALAKIGFTQSYTYFTWRNTKAELTEYLTELTSEPTRNYFGPNFFANTPDILPPILVEGGRPAFLMRLILAATLSPSYGIYSGYELCENDAMAHHAIPEDVEYIDSEKYEIKIRDWNAAGHIKDTIARINRIRRENPAMQILDNLRFLPTDNDSILSYIKATPDRSNALLFVVNLDPFHAQECTVRVDLKWIDREPGTPYEVHDLLSGARYRWGDANYVRLDPAKEVAHVFRIERG